jgi:Chaperone of endosialidase
MSSLPSWKNYGGISNYDKTTNIAVNNITADNLTLRNAYNGYFTICGELIVSDDTFLNSNCIISGSSFVVGDETVAGNILVYGNTIIGNQLDVSGDSVIWGNLLLMRNFEIVGNLEVDGTMIQLNRVDLSTNNYYINLHAVNNKLGFNTSAPTATLDIASDQIAALNVHTSYPANRNILCQNASGTYISLYTDNSINSIQFHQETLSQPNGNGDASISYTKGGILTLNTSKNTAIASNTSIGIGDGSHSIYGETAVIYDSISGAYLPSVYEVSGTQYSTGNALTLMSTTANNQSNTSLNIINGNNQAKGMKMVGGSWIQDPTRSYSTLGVYDFCGNFFPTMTQVAGSSWVKKRATIGINHFSPAIDTYVMDMNGPVRIQNGEIVMVNNSAFNVNNVVWLESNTNIGIAFGGTYGTGVDATGKTVYLRTILYTYDAGNTWNSSTVNVSDFNYSFNNFNTGFVYDASNAICAGDGGVLALSCDGFKTWNTIKNTSIPSTITAVRMLKNSDGSIVIVFAYLDAHTIPLPHIGYFLVSNITQLGASRDSSTNILYLPSPSTSMITSMYGDKPQLISWPSLNNNPINPINSMDTVDGSFGYIAGTGGIYKLLVNDLSFNNAGGKNLFYDSSGAGHISSGIKYNCIRIYKTNPLYAVAVGNSIISYTTNGGSSWSDVSLNISGVNFNSVFIYSTLCAIAVGSNGKLFASTNGFQTWTDLSQSGILNPSGLASLLTNPTHTLTSVWMTDANTFLISSIYSSSNSKIFCCTLPDLFNHVNNFVLDVCGNMRLSGDLYIYDNAYVSKDVDVSGNVRITGNEWVDGSFVNINGSAYVWNHLFTSYVDDISGGAINIGCYGNTTKKIQISGTNNLLNNTINIGGGTDNVNIGASALNIATTGRFDISNNVNMHNSLNVYGSVHSTYYEDLSGGVIQIGSTTEGTPAGGKNIYIGTGSSVSTPNAITLGTVNDNVNIRGKNISLNAAIHSTNLVYLNAIDGVTGGVQMAIGTSAGCGLWFRDYSLDNAGYFVVNSSLDGYLMKAPSADISDNILNIRSNIVTDLSFNDIMTHHKVNNGLLMVKASSTFAGKNTDVVLAPFDVSNILLKDSTVATSTVGQQYVTTDLGLGGQLFVVNATDSSGVGTGSMQLVGGASVGKNLFVGGVLDVSNSIDSSGQGTGALVVSGGVSIGKTVNIAGGVSINNTAVSSNTNSGALIVAGGVGVGGNVFVGGILDLSSNLDASGVGLGVLRVNGGASIGGTTYMNGKLYVVNTTDSSGVGTGALDVSGGMSVGGKTYLGGAVYLTSAVDSSGVGTGTLQVSGGASIAGSTYMGGCLNVVNGTDSSGVGVGALVVSGGASVTKGVSVGGVVNIYNTTDSYGTNTGSLQLSGGMSINKSSSIGGSAAVGFNGVIGAVPIFNANGQPQLFTTLSYINVASSDYRAGTYRINSSCSTDFSIFNGVSTITLSSPWGNGSLYGDTGSPYGWGYLSTNSPFIATTIINNTITSIAGQYLEICLPYNLVLTSYQLAPFSTNFPTSWYIVGSNDGSNYEIIDFVANSTWYQTTTTSTSVPVTFNVALSSMKTAFTYIRIVCTTTLSGKQYVALQQFNLYGIPLPLASNTTLVSFAGASVLGNFALSGTQMITNTTDSSGVNTGALVVRGGISTYGNAHVGGNAIVHSVVDSTGFGLGAFVVNGGVSIAKTVNIGNNTNITNNLTVGNNVAISNNVSIGGVLSVSSSTYVMGFLGIGTATPKYALDVSGDMNVSGKFALGTLSLTANTDYALVLSNGGASIAGSTSIGGNLSIISTYDVVKGAVQSGALNVGGGMYVQKGAIISGNVFVGTDINSTAEFNAIVSCRSGAAAIYKSDDPNTLSGALKVYGGMSSSGNCVVGGHLTVQQNLYILGYFTINSLNLAGTLDSNVSTVGTFTTAGGCGIAGNIFMGGNLNVGSLVDSTSYTKGAMVVQGGAGIGGNCFVGGNSTVTKNMLVVNQIFGLNSQDSYGVNTGSFVTYGGGSIKGNCNIGGNVIIAGTFGSGQMSLPFPARNIYPLLAFSDLVHNIGGVPSWGTAGTSYMLTVTTNSGLDGYMNGVYLFAAGTAYQDSSNIKGVENAFIPGSGTSWISNYVYSSKYGYSVDSSNTIVIRTPYYDSTGTILTTITGDYIQIKSPFKQIMNTYSLSFPTQAGQNGDASKLSYATTWYVLGSNDASTWTYIHDVQANSSALTTQTYTVTQTQYGFLYFRIVFTKLFPTGGDSFINMGVQLWSMNAKGIVQINMNSTDTTSTQYDSNGNITQGAGASSSANSNAARLANINNPCTISSFVGPGTFAGASSLVTFGNTTTYGSINLFYDFNINGNIYAVNPNYMLTFNSDISHNGNLYIRSYCQVGYGSANADTVLNGNLTMTGAWNLATIGGNLLVNGNSVLQKTLTVVGNTYMQNGLFLDNGLTVTSGEVKVNPGRLYVVYGGSDISGASYFRSTLTCNDKVTVTNNGILVNNGGVYITDLSGLHITQGGYDVSGLSYLRSKLTISSGGAQIHDGVTIDNTGLFITSGVLDMSGASNFTGKMTVTNGGLQVHDGIVIDNAGSNAQNTALYVAGGGAYITGTTTSSNQLTVQNGGIVTQNLGLIRSNGGVLIDNSGITVSSGGAYITGTTFSTGQLTVQNGGIVTSNYGLIRSNGGVLVDNSGITVSLGGITISSGGISVTGTTLCNNNLTVPTANVGLGIASSIPTQLSLMTAYSGSTGILPASTISFLTQNNGTPWYCGQIQGYAGAGSANSVQNYPGGLAFYTKPADNNTASYGTPSLRMVINAAGNVGIGTIDPTYVLDVSGAVRCSSITTSSGGSATIASGLTITTGGLTVSAGDSTVQKLTVSGALVASSGVSVTGALTVSTTATITGALTASGGLTVTGALSVSTTATITGALTASGGITVTGALSVSTTATITGNLTAGNVSATSYNATSDYRIKDLIEPLNATYSVDNLKPIRYHNKYSDQYSIGFIAHEVQEIFPDLVNGDKDGETLQSINYIGFIGILVHEVQELKKTVKQLQQEICELKSK